MTVYKVRNTAQNVYWNTTAAMFLAAVHASMFTTRKAAEDAIVEYELENSAIEEATL